MVRSFIEKFKKPVPKTHSLPDGWRVYAIGDIHGRVDLVKVLHRAIIQDARKAWEKNKLVVYLGDYLDRGPYVKETIEALNSGPLSGFEVRYLMGNHERLFLDFLENAALLEMWLGLGGRSTLMSYGVQAPGSGFSPQRAETVRVELLEAVPQDHLEFLKNLKPYFKMGDYLFVHAGIRPKVPLKRQTCEDLFWSRNDVTTPEKDCGFRIIHGHTICERVQTRRNRIGIDTGAYATGILTCAVLEDGRVDFLSTKAPH
jgi:serine/threonine protein phosphatase 1